MFEVHTVIPDLAAPALAAAIEVNASEENAVFGRYLPGAEFHHGEDKVWWITGAPSALYNAIWLARLHDADIEQAIDATMAPFHDRGVPFSWTTGLATRPDDLGARLAARRPSRVIEHLAMVADLQALNEDIATPAGLTVVPVTDMATLRTWRDVSSRGFESTPEDGRLYDTAYLAMGYSDDLPWRHYLGVLDGVAVGASSLLLHGGIAGIYGVATVREARRQGVGAALTLTPLQVARERGYRVATLFPSEMGRSLYSRIGFRDSTAIYHYIFAE